ncbi:HAD family hydrolase [Sphingomonas qomolangmaensis]|uniref:HAD family hydrolase n=1 Tax=Sphingomonas qomolangmaensis TaxID=2918765 RepID=A0ABY5LA86_9SPHN|nr:HAD family hydrolase [Sphingomonas qomolangmaensis]UUL82533.1 HAD family hydrolase [Sphingomonas qomolangmaensis]
MIRIKGLITVFVDADNTLWDTDQVFASAQLALLEQVEAATGLRVPTGNRLDFVRACDQAIAARHHDGLRYPPHLLVRALVFALQGQPSEVAARAAWSNHLPSMPASVDEGLLVKRFFAALKHPPALRAGVVEGLMMLEKANATVLIVTEAARIRVEETTAKLGLAGHFTRVIEGRKRPDLFRRIVRLTGDPAAAYMVGDQLDRDIAPAKEAGLRTIYFPGNFVPRWTPDKEKVGPDHQVSDFAEAAAIILEGETAQSVRAMQA